MQILVSTVNARFDPPVAGPARDRFVVVNQLIPGDGDDPTALRYGERGAGFAALVEVCERGLSKSRNRALAAATSEICLISDDDVTYVPDVCERVERAFAAHPDADIITFAATTPTGAPFRSYPRATMRHSGRSIGGVMSIEIAMRRPAVVAAGLRFDEAFGLGAPYKSGEEYIFLVDAMRAGLTAVFVPEAICTHPDDVSGGYLATDKMLIYSKGAMFRRVFGIGAPLYVLAFALRKSIQRRISVALLLAHMFRGWVDYGRFRRRAG